MTRKGSEVRVLYGPRCFPRSAGCVASHALHRGSVADHRPGVSSFPERDETARLVQAACWIVLGDAQTQGSVPLTHAGRDEVCEEPSADPFVSTGGDYGNCQFGDVLSDEAMAVGRLGERPVPGRSDRLVLFSNKPEVAWSWPPLQVHRVARVGEHLVSRGRVLVGSPNRRLAEHRCEKGEVVAPGQTEPDVADLTLTWG